jgi:alpha/beta hydrolase family protein
MTAVRSQAVTIPLDDAREVSGLLQTPPRAGVCYVLAHGAGAGMSHPFMADIANGLAERRIATLRYQFPYMEQGSKRPDAPKLAQANGASGSHRSIPSRSQTCPGRGRQIVWWPHDLASAGRITLARSSGLGVSRLPASPRWATVERARKSPV